MCGIFYYLATDNPEQSNDHIHKTAMNIKNRGPERTSCLEINTPVKMNIIFHRLAIMNQQQMQNQEAKIPSFHGEQPFKIETDTHYEFFICNGEIYNYKELCKAHNIEVSQLNSDCSIIPLLYHYYKENMVKALQLLNAEFSMCMIRMEKNSGQVNVIAATDHLSIRPMFISWNPKSHLCIASELKALVCNGNVLRAVPGTIYEFSYTPKTENILSTAQIKYVDIENTKFELDMPLEIVCNKIFETLCASVHQMIDTSDRPLGCLLSGGLDSSLVAAIAANYMRKTSGKQLHTFSIGMPGSTDEIFAKKTAEFIGSKHTHVVFKEEDWIAALEKVVYCIESFDVTTVRASTGQYLLSHWISTHTDIKVLLVGDGSDELTGGYLYFHYAPSPLHAHCENIRLLKDIHLYDVLRCDRTVAGHGIEVRVPFLSLSFVQLYLSIDPSLRIPQKGIEKWLLRKAFEPHNFLPNEILYRRKEAFSDGVSSHQNSWSQQIQKYVDSIFTDEQFESAIAAGENLTPRIPKNKEALYYRSLFAKYFTHALSPIIPYYWMPKWVNDIQDPSARCLPIYNELNK